MKYFNSYEGVDKVIEKKIRYHARKLAKSLKQHMEVEDFEQELMLHILECKKIYNPAKAKFSTFVEHILKNKIADFVKAATAAKCVPGLYEMSLDELLDGDYELEDSYDMLDAIYTAVDLSLAKGKLTAQLAEVLEQLTEHSVNEIARLTGVSQSCMYKRVTKLRNILRSNGICHK